MSAPTETKLWGGRFTGATEPLMELSTPRCPTTRRCTLRSLEGTRVYTAALEKLGLITKHELSEIHPCIRRYSKEWESNSFVEKAGDEDIHTADERAQTRWDHWQGHCGQGPHWPIQKRPGCYRYEIICPWRAENHPWAAGQLGWRYDQACREGDGHADARLHPSAACPAYQGWGTLALPPRASLPTISRDLTRSLSVSTFLLLAVVPLLATPLALIVSSLVTTSALVASLVTLWLPCLTVTLLSKPCSGDPFCFDRLPKMSEDLIIYFSAEFGFIKLADAYSTGSSLMPQKKNPDSLELLRGKFGAELLVTWVTLWSPQVDLQQGSAVEGRCLITLLLLRTQSRLFWCPLSQDCAREDAGCVDHGYACHRSCRLPCPQGCSLPRDSSPSEAVHQAETNNLSGIDQLSAWAVQEHWQALWAGCVQGLWSWSQCRETYCCRWDRQVWFWPSSRTSNCQLA